MACKQLNTKEERMKHIKRYYGLDCDYLAKIKDLTHEEWLQCRREGITGSDLGGLSKLNKYTSPMKVYLDKVGELPEQIDNEKMHWGRVMEDVIAKEFKERNEKFKVQKVNAVLRHREYPWALGNIDRLVIDENGERGILEIKTVSEFLSKVWEGETTPPQYMVQLQWYMFVADVKFGYFAALIGGNRYVQKYVERDDELIHMLLNISEDFWNYNVGKRIPPAIDGSEATTQLLNNLYPGSKEDSEIEMDEKLMDLIEKREEIKKKIKDMKVDIAECENLLKSELKDNERGVCRDKKIIWKSYSRTTLDGKKLRADYPEIYDKYSKTSSCRKFEIR